MTPRRPLIVAHRGASAEYPENTCAAFDAALALGCEAIELDIQASKDEVPVVYHDWTALKVGGGRRRISSLDAPELAKLDAGSWLDKRFAGQHIPKLEEVLRRYGRRTRLLLEIKSRADRKGRQRRQRLVRDVASLVARLKVEANVSILSFDQNVLDTMAEVAPALPRVLNLRPPRRPGIQLSRRMERLAAISADVRSLTPSFGHSVRRRGLALFVYTCNSPAKVEQALAAGATGIMSDRPGWLRDYLSAGDPHRAT